MSSDERRSTVAAGSTFTITSATTAVTLDANRTARAAFTVTNALSQPLTGRAKVVPVEGTNPLWLGIEGAAERQFEPNGTQQYAVKIAVPPTEPAKKCTFKLRVVGIANPDELFGEGPAVGFEIPAPKNGNKPFPWIWILVAAAILLLVAAGVAGWILTHRQPDIRFDPAQASFSSQRVNVASPAKTVTITNSGSVDLHVTSITVSGTNAADFGIGADSCSGRSIASGKSCTVGVIFTPHQAGPRAASLVIPSDSKGGLQSLALSGKGIQGLAQVSPATVNLRYICTITTPFTCKSSAGVVTVKNSGDADLHVTSVKVSGPPFYIHSDNCTGKTIGPQAQCQFGVQYQPPGFTPPSATGSVMVADDSLTPTQTISLTGEITTS